MRLSRLRKKRRESLCPSSEFPVPLRRIGGWECRPACRCGIRRHAFSFGPDGRCEIRPHMPAASFLTAPRLNIVNAVRHAPAWFVEADSCSLPCFRHISSRMAGAPPSRRSWLRMTHIASFLNLPVQDETGESFPAAPLMVRRAISLTITLRVFTAFSGIPERF